MRAHLLCRCGVSILHQRLKAGTLFEGGYLVDKARSREHEVQGLTCNDDIRLRGMRGIRGNPVASIWISRTMTGHKRWASAPSSPQGSLETREGRCWSHRHCCESSQSQRATYLASARPAPAHLGILGAYSGAASGTSHVSGMSRPSTDGTSSSRYDHTWQEVGHVLMMGT